MNYFAISLLIAAGLTTLPLRAQSSPVIDPSPTIDVEAGFLTIHANAAPTDCGCFFMYGASGEVVANDPSGIGLMLDFGYTQTTDINGGSHNLALYTYLAGPRYAFHSKSKFTPFGEVLAGVAHSSTNFLIDEHTSTVAFATGGGLDYRITPRFDIRLLNAEYLLTHVPNGQNDRQNQLRITAGIVFHVTRLK